MLALYQFQTELQTGAVPSSGLHFVSVEFTEPHGDIYEAARAGQAEVPGRARELRVNYGQLNRFFWDYVQNIRQGGIFVPTAQPFEIGTQLCFVLHVPHVDEPIEIRGRVHWNLHQEECEPGQEPGMGIGFMYATATEEQRIIAQVERLMVSSLGPLLYEHLVGRHLPTLE
ncbi:MAG: PilZ domain-containing protein [Myxococcales bacterium]|nr:PilZ domain-containing protein [Myxococcales bacterium]